MQQRKLNTVSMSGVPDRNTVTNYWTQEVWKLSVILYLQMICNYLNTKVQLRTFKKHQGRYFHFLEMTFLNFKELWLLLRCSHIYKVTTKWTCQIDCGVLSSFPWYILFLFTLLTAFWIVTSSICIWSPSMVYVIVDSVRYSSWLIHWILFHSVVILCDESLLRDLINTHM